MEKNKVDNEEESKMLYKEYLNGNQKAFEKIVLMYKNNLIYFINKYVNNMQIAEDISQDVFVYILINKEQYDFKYSLKTYLYMIAKCRAINYLKKEAKNVKVQDYDNLYKDERQLEDFIFARDKDRKIREVLKNMKQEYQTVIILNVYEGFKYKEIAKIMQKNIIDVKSLIHRAKKRLKKLLEKEGIGYDE